MAGKILTEPSYSLKQFRLLTGLTDTSNVMSKVSLATRLCRKPGTDDHIGLKIPLISAAMQSVSGVSLAVGLAQHGGISVIPCSIPIDGQVETVRKVKRYKAGFQKDVITVSPKVKISEIVGLMKETGYGKFPVTEDGTRNTKLLGLIGRKNVDRKDHAGHTVSEHMMTDITTAEEGISLKDANNKMIEHGIDVLPIVDKEGKLKFMVFKKDMEKHLDFPESAVDMDKRYLVAGAISTQPQDRERADALIEAGADVIFIDSSDGFSIFQKEALEHVRTRSPSTPVVGGNIITAEGFRFLAEAGMDAVKVGMGIGSGCTTQEQKGTGRGQATALIDVCKARDEYKEKTGTYIPVICDGSVANAGQIAVALALGADAVMMGRFFAQFTESEGGLRQHPSMGPLKEYWMEASARAKSYGRYETTAKTFFEEGVEGYVPHIGSIYDNLMLTVLKLKSAFSSAGCKDLEELHTRSVLELQSTGAQQDSAVHDIIAK